MVSDYVVEHLHSIEYLGFGDLAEAFVRRVVFEFLVFGVIWD